MMNMAKGQESGICQWAAVVNFQLQVSHHPLFVVKLPSSAAPPMNNPQKRRGSWAETWIQQNINFIHTCSARYLTVKAFFAQQNLRQVPEPRYRRHEKIIKRISRDMPSTRRKKLPTLQLGKRPMSCSHKLRESFFRAHTLRVLARSP